MCQACEELGLKVEVHHHEVAHRRPGRDRRRFEHAGRRRPTRCRSYKYALLNVAHGYGKTATFMPKPLVGDNGSGMHVHQSLAKDGKNLFAGDAYAGLSDIALYYIGGIIKHARALNAFTNPGTNCYKRLVPGFEAPVMLAYSRAQPLGVDPHPVGCRTRRAAASRCASRTRTANPYLAFAAMLMAGLDGIQNKIHPGDASDKDLYDLPPEEAKNIPRGLPLARHGARALDEDREFLKRGGVFTDDLIDAYIALKQEEVDAFPHDDAPGGVRHVLQRLRRRSHFVSPVRQGLCLSPCAAS